MYYDSKKLKEITFEEVIEKVKVSLKKEGFGVLTEIDVKNTFKQKLDLDFKKYTILGACNPHFAYQAIGYEDKIGTMLPCNVVVIEQDNGEIEVAAVDPMASMVAIENPLLSNIAKQVNEKLKIVLEGV